jgi:hypothetical protein
MINLLIIVKIFITGLKEKLKSINELDRLFKNIEVIFGESLCGLSQRGYRNLK